MFIEHKEAGEEKQVESAEQVLLAAADYMEINGYCQGSYQRGSRVCTLGAMMAVTNSTEWRWEPAMHEAVKKLSYAIGKRIPAWNDEEGRTKEQVISKMRVVALGG